MNSPAWKYLHIKIVVILWLNFSLSYFFVKKIPLSRRVEYVKDGSMDHSVSELVSE